MVLNDLLQSGNAWLFVPSALLLGALHGLEPGHSKTMMAAFIIAIGGTVRQALLLGLAATLSHTAVVWVVALAGLHFGQHWQAETSEPYFQLGSALLIMLVALWMLWRTWRDQHGHGHDHDHHHVSGRGTPQPGAMALSRPSLHTVRRRNGALALGAYRSLAPAGTDLPLGGDDAHARAHAAQIQRRFARRQVTTGQIVLFGLTGGLVPCPASITVLLLCLQLQHVALGATLVLCFSLGLACTLVASGVVAALGVKHLAGRMPGMDKWAGQAAYLSAGLMLLVALYLATSGLAALR